MKVRLSGTLIRFTNHRKEIDVEASTIGEGIQHLIGQYPRLGPVLLDNNGDVRGLQQLLLNGEPVERGNLDRPVGTDDKLHLLMTVAGG